ncbi:MAG: hypothetical protein CL916_10045 [Deltaproteobacteria bacterium]|nr:hypothetical protein [Deltaproteobacteria bacterium]
MVYTNDGHTLGIFQRSCFSEKNSLNGYASDTFSRSMEIVTNLDKGLQNTSLSPHLVILCTDSSKEVNLVW